MIRHIDTRSVVGVPGSRYDILLILGGDFKISFTMLKIDNCSISKMEGIKEIHWWVRAMMMWVGAMVMWVGTMVMGGRDHDGVGRGDGGGTMMVW